MYTLYIRLLTVAIRIKTGKIRHPRSDIREFCPPLVGKRCRDGDFGEMCVEDGRRSPFSVYGDVAEKRTHAIAAAAVFALSDYTAKSDKGGSTEGGSE